METEKNPLMRHWRLWVLSLLFMAGGLGYAGFRLASQAGPGALVSANGNEVGGSFRLVSLGDSTVTEGDFRGSWLLVWFFDPHCPAERCQPVLKSLETMVTTLKAEGASLSPIAVSLDAYAEDTDLLKDYVLPVAPHVMPYIGTPNMIRAMTAEYHAPFHKEGGVYLPAPSIVVMDPRGRYAGMIEADGDAETMLHHMRALLSSR